MISVNGTNATTDINYTGALSPDALMVYCESRLRGIDGQMNEQFEKQQKSRAATSAVTTLQQKLAAAAATTYDAVDGIRECDAGTRDDIVAGFDAAIEATKGTPQQAQLEAQKAAFMNDAGDGAANANHIENEHGDGKMSKTELSNMASNIGNISKDMSSSAELDMIQLQSLMSQRQTAIQMCTNLVSSLGESLKATAQKIGS